MKKFIALLLFSGSMFVTAALAQCPEISVTGPSGIIPPDRAMKFTAKVDRIENDPPLKYAWSISSGTIVSGQGTPTIEVKRKGTSLTATVEISGLPENCLHTASERGWSDPAPTPVKVGVWQNDADLIPLKQFVAEMAIEAGHQGYVFIVRGPCSTQESLNELRNTVLSFGPKEQNGDSPRITIIEREGPDELAEIWRVPPGASNPECESCRKPDCPELTTSGPTSVPILGKPVMFSLSLSGNIPADLRFKWTTSKGRIVTGQGTKSIQIMPPWEKDWRLVVTIDVIGLPFGCTASAVEIVMPGDREHPVLIDEFDITPDFQDPYRLNTALAELNVNPADHLFVVLFHPNSESPFVLGQVIKLIKKLTDILGSIPELSNDRFSIVRSPTNGFRLRIYRISPGAEKPIP